MYKTTSHNTKILAIFVASFMFGCAALGRDNTPAELQAYEVDSAAIAAMQTAQNVVQIMQENNQEIPESTRISLLAAISAVDASRTAMRGMIDRCKALGKTLEDCQTEVYVTESIRAVAAQTASVLAIVETF